MPAAYGIHSQWPLVTLKSSGAFMLPSVSMFAVRFGVLTSVPVPDGDGDWLREFVSDRALESFRPTAVNVLLEHDANFQLATSSDGSARFTVTPNGLLVEFGLLKHNAYIGSAVAYLMARGYWRSASYRPSCVEHRHVQHNGEWVREVTHLELDEVSLTDQPAYPQTQTVLFGASVVRGRSAPHPSLIERLTDLRTQAA